MQTPTTINTLKTLQMVLTTLLLVLAVLAQDWQEGVGQKSKVAAAPVKEPVYAGCCLQHALQAAEGGNTRTGQIHPRHVGQVLQFGPLLLLQADSARQMAASLY
ncbi:hypothetical protein [Pontibacter flavimaris]|uniref:Uncharacterized protein n=1 Tax=Pontibacter flavimaris TaxID=1797110 RepID=A0A1Q5P9U6_9BACT|nr:hypothetical protein [Pontibacter flavimaris]OKL38998.1 hypothetical protein A3841_03350 [Pontibacter flavimaris]